MCGRYIANSEDEIMEIREILKQISLRLADTEMPSALTEVFPTDDVVMINKAFGFTKAKFGLEKWDKKGIIINARSETYENNFFRQFAGNRCIIPAHGYYEWRKLPDKTKVKYIFSNDRDSGKHGIFMAAIHDKDSRFAVITRPAVSEIEFIHPRMPVLIRAEQAEDWLSGKADVRELAEQHYRLVCEEAV